MVRFDQYLRFQLDFQLRLLLLALKMEIFGEELENISSREWWNDIVVHGDVRGECFVIVCVLVLTMVAVVVVEIWGEVFPVGEI